MAEPRSLFNVILDASLEVRSPVVYATFIIALVFMPVLMMTGVQGRLFAPLGTSFILAIMASLVVALTVIPALSYFLLARIEPHREPGYVRWLKARHCHWLELASKRPRTVIALALVLCLGAAATLPFFGGEFLPEFREGHFIVHMLALPGTSLEESLRMGRQVSLELLKNPHIRSVSQQAGRAEQGEDTQGPHYSELHVDLQPLSGEEAEGAESEIRQTLGKFPGLTFQVLPFLAERIEETISGVTAQFVINIFGDDFNVLDQKAAEIHQVPFRKCQARWMCRWNRNPVCRKPLRTCGRSGCCNSAFALWTCWRRFRPRIKARLWRRLMREHGSLTWWWFFTRPIARVPDTAGIAYSAQRRGGALRMPLGELADIYSANSRYLITHDGARRRQQVTCNIANGDAAAFAQEVKKQIGSKVSLPQGVYLAYSGSAEEQKQARHDLLLHSLIAAVGIVLLLAIEFGTTRNLLLILANLPFALVGGVLAVFATGGLLSIGSLVGFVTLFGITMRNSIMMISHFEHLVQKEGMTWGPEAAIRGASERLLPILMTALVTALGLLPLAIGSGEAGREIEGPMAIVILGGLLTSTVLNLLVLPTLALRYGRFVSDQQTNH